MDVCLNSPWGVVSVFGSRTILEHHSKNSPVLKLGARICFILSALNLVYKIYNRGNNLYWHMCTKKSFNTYFYKNLYLLHLLDFVSMYYIKFVFSFKSITAHAIKVCILINNKPVETNLWLKILFKAKCIQCPTDIFEIWMNFHGALKFGVDCCEASKMLLIVII